MNEEKRKNKKKIEFEQKREDFEYKFKQKQDGMTWMVSIIHPDNPESSSAWYSERAGNNALEAAKSYYNDDPSDNPGAAKCLDDPDLVIICVIGQEIAPSKKPWKIFLFAINEKNEIVPFP
jgi:hypothetical protein